MLNMFPKFALVAMNTYFSVLANVTRPSRTPSTNTPRSLSNSTMSAASLATSTALSTEIPTSAACSADASLMPSPIYPTTCPAFFSARMFVPFDSAQPRENLHPVHLRQQCLIARLPEVCARLHAADSTTHLFAEMRRDEMVITVTNLNETPNPLSEASVSAIPAFGGS